MRKIKTIFFVFVITVAILLPIHLYFNIYLPTRAEGETVIQAQSVDSDSKIVEKNDVINFNIDSRDKTSLLKTPSEGASGVYNLIQRVPKYKTNKETRNLIPEDFAANSRLTKMSDEKNGRQHYCYQQKIKGVPVYGGNLCLHFKNETELDSINGSLLKDQELAPEKIDKTQAEQVALNTASSEIDNSFELKVYESKKVVFNQKLLGLGEDTTSKPVQEIKIAASNLNDLRNIYLTKFLIDLTDGKVIQKDNLIAEALSRFIYDCTANPQDCALKRGEGSAPVGIADIDSAYNFFGDTYNFYKNSFARDSFDNIGAALKVLTNTPAVQGIKCPNASWITAPYKQWQFCAGMVVGDIVTHEYTHALTEHTANLTLSNQSGSINESISDIFAYAVNPTNWLMGEGSALGVIRNMQDPPSSPKIKQPDRLFSTNYFCSSEDNGGIHINNGVINKSFYLMTDGGDFNGCNIIGQGREKTVPIIYRALTTYLTQTSNFLSFYTGVSNACSDLHGGENSSVCTEVKKAMRATEIDQQPVGSQSGAKCMNILRRTPDCTAPAAPIPTMTLTPTPTNQPAGVPTATKTPTLNSSVTPAPAASSDKLILKLKVKLQGVAAGANIATPEIVAKLVAKSAGISKEVDATFKFDGSTWTATSELDIPEKDDYAILIKGPSHIRKKICDSKPTETTLGTYNCSDGNIVLKKGINELDFSGIYLLTGDVDQNGVVDSLDLSKIRSKLGFRGQFKEDVNFDQVVDTQDFALVIQSLLFKQDEE